MIDRLEKAGRMVLWFAIALVVLLYPAQAFLRDRETARQLAAAKAEAVQEKLAREKEKKGEADAKKPVRLALASMGGLISALEGSVGHVWFSNASAREGVVCISGTASNGGQSTDSLAACEHVDAYESNVKMNLMFAGGDVRGICPTTPCAFKLKDVPIAAPLTVAAAP